MPCVVIEKSAGIVAHVADEYAELHWANVGPFLPVAPAFVKVNVVNDGGAMIS